MSFRAAVALAAALPLTGADEPARSPFGRALFKGADPAALVEGGRVWLYPTGGKRLRARSSVDLVTWTQSPDLLRLRDVRWIADGAPEHGLWAPHMTAANGRYYLYYSVGPQFRTPSRIGVAVCDTPAGPCRDSGRPLLGRDSDRFRAARSGACADDMRPTGDGRFGFEAIDPMVFADPHSGRRLLYAGGSNGATLRVFELAPDMVTVAREVTVDQPPCFTEGAWMHERSGVYYLSYSSGHYDRSDYSVRYATAPTPTGPWTYRGAILRSGAGAKGPGHHSFFRDPRTGAELIAYHCWEGVGGDGPYRDAKRRVALARVRYRADGTIEPIDPGATPPVAVAGTPRPRS